MRKGFMTPHPNDMSDDVIDAIGSLKNYVNLCICQSKQVQTRC